MRYSYFFFIIIYMQDIKYKLSQDKKMIGTIILLISAAFQIFAFLKVPVISTIHGYTIGMLFGFYNPVFYLFIIYKSSLIIFESKINLPKWVKLSNFSYWFLSISIIFIGTSLFYYQNIVGYTSIGTAPWGSFKSWFNNFTSTTAWAPENTNGGIIGAFMYSFFSMCVSGVGTLIIAILSLITSISVLVTGTFFGLYKNMLNRQKVTLKQKEIEAENELHVDSFMDSDNSSNDRSASEFIAQNIDQTRIENSSESSVENQFDDFAKSVSDTQDNPNIKTDSDNKEFFPFDDPFE